MSKEYNGHPSYEHWNASLWVGNDEGLYGIACQGSVESAVETLLELYPVTGDDVKMTPKLTLYAVKCARGIE